MLPMSLFCVVGSVFKYDDAVVVSVETLIVARSHPAQSIVSRNKGTIQIQAPDMFDMTRCLTSTRSGLLG